MHRFLLGKSVIWAVNKVEKQQLTAQQQQFNEKVQAYAPKVESFLTQINSIILDKSQQTKLALSCLFAGGHVLFEDLPGLGKTTLSSALSHLAGLKFQRIQFTNDMLASDVIGVNMFNQKEHQFEFKYGPIFTQMKSIAVARKPKVLYLKRWKRVWSLSMACVMCYRNLFG